MKTRTLVGALIAAGLIGGGVGAAMESPFGHAQAAPYSAAGVAAPVANPSASTLPLNGFTELVKKYGPAVVNVSVEGTRKVRADSEEFEMPDIPGLQDNPAFRDFFRGFRGRIPMPQGQMNAHVVDGADHVTVKLTDRREFRAKVVGADKQTDIAVLKIDAKSLPTVKIGSSAEANVGEWVAAIGSPFGFENSVSAGIVSAKGRSLPDSSYVNFIQTDVAVNPGNSGGPLFNLAGEVIGINSQIYSRSGGFQGISFAIPVEIAMNVKDQIVKHGKVTRGRIGVTVQEVNSAFAESFGLDRPHGALVSAIEEGLPGDKAGLEVGDVILKYDGRSIERSADLPVLVGDTAPGKSVPMDVWRKGAMKHLTVAPTQGEAKEAVAENDRAAPQGRLGVAVRALTADERKENGGKAGLYVERAAGAAARAGIQQGDILLAFNGAPLTKPEQLREHVAKAGKSAALLVQRENRQLFVAVELG